MLGRLSHDSNEEVAQAASLALGIVGAGTNNARLASQLRQLSSYYYKDPSLLFLVRIAQGLVHLGKGLLTLSPAHSDRSLNSNVALAGLITIAFSMLDMKHTILGKHHYMLYYLFVAAQPRMLMTVDEEGKPLPVCPCVLGRQWMLWAKLVARRLSRASRLIPPLSSCPPETEPSWRRINTSL